MWTSLVPGLLLTAVTFSTSDVLPMLESEHNSLHYGLGQMDNGFGYKHKGDIDNTIYTVPVISAIRHWPLRKQSDYDTNQKVKQKLPDDFREIYYDDKGFRTEQWHNYPRQLDRLREYLDHYRHDTSTGSDPNDFQRALARFDKLRPQVFHGPRIIAKTDETLSNRKDLLETDENYNNVNDEETINHEIIPFVKVDRQSPGLNIDLEVSPAVRGSKKKVSKRIFSLWSRLQDLSPKGHDLPHRRHIAFYALPHNAARGGLSAETRAQLRPPGSPLRWG